MTILRIALAQINLVVGDLQGNETKIVGTIKQAREQGAAIVAFPELAVTGYPPEDLLLKPGFVDANLATIQRIADAATGITAIVGYVDRDDDPYNAAGVLHNGALAAVYHKRYLPNYAVFDEERYFGHGEHPLVLAVEKATVGINICEDIWVPAGPTRDQALAGADLIINISASPYHAGKGPARERMLATRAADNTVYVAFCNLVGGQDELLFEGGSVIFDERGELVARAELFQEDLLVTDLDLSAVFRHRLHEPRRREEQSLRGPAAEVRQVALDLAERPSAGAPAVARISPRLDADEEIYKALVLGTRDYVRKNGFQHVIVGLSGGIDSSLTASIAADALGPDNVTSAFMPSRHSSTESAEDSAQLAGNLGIRYLTIPIDDTYAAYLEMLKELLAGTEPDVTEENIQARIRGNVLMALSNKFGWLVLTTGNKSEMSVGYATLYGDMAGGFAVIKDVPKLQVYRLARYVNRRENRAVIPQRVLEKAPSAELRPDQKDTDSLPPYDVLDPILRAYVEEDRSWGEMVAMGMDPDTVRQVIRMVDRSEYKRRQAPPGVRITHRGLGKDRRLPITNHFRAEGEP
jgi:NAD+ synthase (glutamine-hydrolysing)